MSTELAPRQWPMERSKQALERSKQSLVSDLKGLIDDADDVLKEVANSGAEEFSAVRTKVAAKLGEVKSRFDDARIAVGQKASGAANAANQYVGENPWKVIALAASAGLIIGFLFSRR